MNERQRQINQEKIVRYTDKALKKYCQGYLDDYIKLRNAFYVSVFGYNRKDFCDIFSKDRGHIPQAVIKLNSCYPFKIFYEGVSEVRSRDILQALELWANRNSIGEEDFLNTYDHMLNLFIETLEKG